MELGVSVELVGLHGKARMSRGVMERKPSAGTDQFREIQLMFSRSSMKERNTMLVAQNAKYWNSTSS
jgi:hypothetical protein